MSTWTCNAGKVGRILRPVIFVGLTGVLAGCLAGETGTGLGFLGADTKKSEAKVQPVQPEAAFFDGAVVLRGPQGYCIARDSVRTGLRSGFALLAGCDSFRGASGQLVAPAVITVSVSAKTPGAAAPDAPQLAAALSGDEVIETRDEDGVALVHLATGGNEIVPGGDPAHWRGAMMVNDHLLGLAVYAPEGGSMSGAAGGELMLRVAEMLRKMSPETADAS